MAMTLAYDEGYDGVSNLPGKIRRITATWTSDGSGDATATTRKIVGYLLKGVTDPGATAPTDNYDITLTDDASANILSNCFDDLADRDTANTETVHFNVSSGAATDPGGNGSFPAVCSTITIAVANAGDTKSGVLYLYYAVP